MKKLTELIFSIFGNENTKKNEWAVKYMSVEYQKEYMGLKKAGVDVTPGIAFEFLRNIGDKNVN